MRGENVQTWSHCAERERCGVFAQIENQFRDDQLRRRKGHPSLADRGTVDCAPWTERSLVLPVWARHRMGAGDDCAETFCLVCARMKIVHWVSK